jgi:MFS family permease
MSDIKDTGKPQARSRFYYGYIIVVASALILVIMHGIGSSFGIFFSEFQEEFGWNRATISGATSLSFFLLGLFSTIAGRITDRYGPRVTMAISAVVLITGYVLLSTTHTIWQLYLFYGAAISLGNSGGDMAVLPTVARWFVKQRGLMSSIVKAGTGIGMFTIPLVSAWLITSFNWRTAYVVLGITAFVIIIGFSRLLKRDPEEMGLRPYGTDERNVITGGITSTGLSTREMLHTGKFWLLAGSYFLVWFVTQSTMVHIAPHGVDAGLSLAQAASILSIIGGVSIVGRLTMGNASDRIGMHKAVLVCYGVLLTAVILLQFTDISWLLYLFAPAYGFAHGGFFAIISPLVAEMFGIKSHAGNLGMLFFIGMSGGAVGPIITGRIFDMTGSYQAAFITMLAATVAGLTLALFVRTAKQN